MLKACRELLFKLGVLRESKAGQSFALGIKLYKLCRHILGRRLGTTLGFMPIRTAHSRELNASVIFPRAYIFANHFKSVAWNKQLIRAGIFYRYIISCNTVYSDALYSLKESYSVICVNHVITRLKLGIAHYLLPCTARFTKHSLTALVSHN